MLKSQHRKPIKNQIPISEHKSTRSISSVSSPISKRKKQKIDSRAKVRLNNTPHRQSQTTTVTTTPIPQFSQFSQFSQPSQDNIQLDSTGMTYPIPSIALEPGQYLHILKDLPPTFQKRYTTAVTITNPETHSPTEHDNILLDHYYDPEFDELLFNLTLQTYSLRFPIKFAGKVIPQLQRLNMSTKTRARAVQDDIQISSFPPQTMSKQESSSMTHKRYLITEGHLPIGIHNEPFESFQPGSESLLKLITTLPQELQNIINEFNIEIVPHTIQFNYQYFNYDEVMTALLKPGMAIPSSYSPTGHIAHFNLREEHLPWQYIMGRVLCDKANGVQTVINKVGKINNIFRNFQAEILYGKNDLVTEIRENGFNFVLDFSQVYWNSRLLTEHGRLTKFIHKWWRHGGEDSSSDNQKITNQQKVDGRNEEDLQQQQQQQQKNENHTSPTYALDLFGGIGPFVIPLVKNQGDLSIQHLSFGYNSKNQSKCTVWGNDINPKSSLYMWKNAIKNRLILTAEQLEKDAKRAGLKKKGIEQKEREQMKNGEQKNVNTKPTQQQHQQQQDQQQQQQQSKSNPLDIEPAIRVFNSCGRELMTTIAKQQMTALLVQKFRPKNSSHEEDRPNSDQIPTEDHPIPKAQQFPLPFFQHAIMNLPASAVEFLDMFVGLYTSKSMIFVPEIETLTDLSSPLETMNDNINNNDTISNMKKIKKQQEEQQQNHIIYLTSDSNLSQIDTKDTTYLTNLENIPILPPHFDQGYELLVDNMPITDANHHWSNLQQLYLTQDSNNSTKNDQKGKNLTQNQPNTRPLHTISIENTLNTTGNLYVPSIRDIQTVIMKRDVDEIFPKSQKNSKKSTIQPTVRAADRNNLIVHCHCFVRDAIDPFGEALNLVEGYLGFQLEQQEQYQSNNNHKISTPLPSNQSSQSIPMSYNNQLPIINDDNLSNLHSILSTAINETPVLNLDQRQQSYLTSPHFAEWRTQLDPYTPQQSSIYKETPQVLDELLLMEYCLEKDGLFIHHVRNVAPGKEMMCVSFIVPDYVLFYSPDYHKHLGQLMMKQIPSMNGKNEQEIANFFISGLNDGGNDENQQKLMNILSDYDQTQIDPLDLNLWAQQTVLKGMITPTSFIQRRVESMLQAKLNSHQQDNNDMINDQADENGEKSLSKEPNHNTRGRESPIVKSITEVAIVQPVKKTKH